MSGVAPSARRVAHLVRRYGEISQTFVADIIREAERHGWEGWVVSKERRANPAVFPFPPDERVLRPHTPRWRRVAGRRAPPATREQTASWWVPPIRTAKPDLLHVHFGWTGAEIALSRLRAPVLVSFHGSDVTAWPTADPSRPALYAALFREITWATATSRFIEQRLRALGYEGPLELLPAGVRLADFPFREPATSGAGVRLLFVGRQVACKGLDVLLRALPLIVAPVPVLLDVIGDGNEREANEQLAGHLGVGRCVRFLGARPRRDVVESMTAADILIVPSRVTSIGEAEGSPVAPKEALAIGLPVVATDVGGLPEVVPPEHRHELVMPENPSALAARITDLVAERSNWPERARIGRQFVEQRFDWTQLGRRTVRIYEQAVAARRG
jgi:colanic acid/amylovoran biosynthesis glycosyltransferase